MKAHAIALVMCFFNQTGSGSGTEDMTVCLNTQAWGFEGPQWLPVELKAIF